MSSIAKKVNTLSTEFLERLNLDLISDTSSISEEEKDYSRPGGFVEGARGEPMLSKQGSREI